MTFGTTHFRIIPIFGKLNRIYSKTNDDCSIDCRSTPTTCCCCCCCLMELSSMALVIKMTLQQNHTMTEAQIVVVTKRQKVICFPAPPPFSHYFFLAVKNTFSNFKGKNSFTIWIRFAKKNNRIGLGN